MPFNSTYLGHAVTSSPSSSVYFFLCSKHTQLQTHPHTRSTYHQYHQYPHIAEPLATMSAIVFAIFTIAALVARKSNMLSSNVTIYTSLTLVVVE